MWDTERNCGWFLLLLARSKFFSAQNKRWERITLFLGPIEYQKTSSTAGRHLKVNSKSALALPAFYPGLEYPATTDWNNKFGRCLDWLIWCVEARVFIFLDPWFHTMMSEVCVVVECGSEHREAQREHKMYKMFFEWVSGDSPRKTKPKR